MLTKTIQGLPALVLVCTGAAAFAQADYPNRPIRLLVGVGPGGAADNLARAVGQHYAGVFHQQVIIDNRAGANQTIAADITAKSAPDGYTIAIIASAHAISPALYKLPYDSLRDFSALGMIAMVPNILVVHPAISARSVKDLITLARARPAELNFGSSGIGSASHLSAELFQTMAQVRFVHVPFKGQGLAMIDLLGGHMQLGFPSVPASIQHIKAGKMIALAVTTRQRSSALPEVLTMNEAGLTGYEVSGWYALVGPAKMPRPIVAKLNGELNRMLQDPAAREILAREGADPLPGTPDEFAHTLADDIRKWAKVVKDAGIKVE